MSDLLTAVGLFLALEGALYALFPEFMKKLLVQAIEMPPETLRIGGLVSVGFGVIVVWLVRM